ncbi:MAG: TetR/AcrR family transcriptional regulator [Aquihabitans sp.]
MATRGPYRKGEVVREEILQAADELLAERGPFEVSVRDIAERAGVQHSVVHRHFETKDGLFAEVVKRTTARYAEAITDVDDPAAGFVAGMTYMADHRAGFTALVRTVASSAVRDDITRFPGFALHLERLAPGAPDRGPVADGDGEAVDPRVLGAALMALTSGWAFLEDWWLASAGIDAGDRDAARAQIGRIIQQLVDQHAPPR